MREPAKCHRNLNFEEFYACETTKQETMDRIEKVKRSFSVSLNIFLECLEKRGEKQPVIWRIFLIILGGISDGEVKSGKNGLESRIFS